MIKTVMACLALLTLAACNDVQHAGTPASVQAASTTMPPMRSAACADSALVDEKCTAAWYACSDDHATCSRHWEDCCRATTVSK
jgi:hypothetical protein